MSRSSCQRTLQANHSTAISLCTPWVRIMLRNGGHHYPCPPPLPAPVACAWCINVATPVDTSHQSVDNPPASRARRRCILPEATHPPPGCRQGSCMPAASCRSRRCMSLPLLAPGAYPARALRAACADSNCFCCATTPFFLSPSLACTCKAGHAVRTLAATGIRGRAPTPFHQHSSDARRWQAGLQGLLAQAFVTPTDTHRQPLLDCPSGGRSSAPRACRPNLCRMRFLARPPVSRCAAGIRESTRLHTRSSQLMRSS